MGPQFSQDGMDQQHTYLQEKYMQEAEAQAQEKPRFLHKTVRGFDYSRGPTDVQNPKNYNQKLTTFLEDSLDDCEEDPQQFPGMVEGFFKENLLKRYNLIRYLKAEIRREKVKNSNLKIE